MRFPLLRHALSEHLVAGGGFAVLVIALLLSMLDRDDHGRFVVFGEWTVVLGLLAPWLAAHRLIVRPYQDHSQDFLEALPLSRLRLVLLRLGLGGATLGALHVAAWAFCWWWQMEAQAIDATAALGALCGMGLALQALWAWAALGAYMGRYRYLIWSALWISLAVLIRLELFPDDQLPLVGLLTRDAGVATSWPAPRALAEAALILVSCHLASITLAMHQDGAFVRSLARPMSHREMVGAAVGFVVVLMGTDDLDSDKQKPPLSLKDASRADDGAVHVEVMHVDGLTEVEGAATARHLAADARALLDVLEVPATRPLLVLPQRGIDPGRSVIPTLRAVDGAAVVLSVEDARGDTPWLRASLLHRLLEVTSTEAAVEEERHWLLDGLTTWWTARHDEAAVAQQWARAATVEPRAEDLRGWRATRERLGSCRSDALAFAAVQSVVDALGEDVLLSVARATFPPADSAWEAWWEAGEPEALLEQRGLSLDALGERVRAALATRPEGGAPLEVTTDVRFVEPLGQQRRIEVSLTSASAPAWWVRYYKLEPWSSDVSDQESRFDVVVGASVARLPGVWLRGERVLVSVEVEDPTLGCAVRVRSERMVVP